MVKISLEKNKEKFREALEKNTTIRSIVADISDGRAGAISECDGETTKTISCYELKVLVKRIGGYLVSQGVKKGDLIGLMAENRLEWPVVYLAAVSVGAVIVPLDVFLMQVDVNNIVKKINLKKVFVSEMFARTFQVAFEDLNSNIDLISFDTYSLEENASIIDVELYENIIKTDKFECLYESVDVRAEDPASMIFMSGDIFTTLTHGSISSDLYATLIQVNATGECYLPGEKTAIMLPFHHTWPTVGGILMPLASGGEIICLSNVTPDVFVRTLVELKVEYAAMVPFLLERVCHFMTKRGVTLPDLKFMIVGGSSTHVSVFEAMQDLGCKVLQGYGLSECSPVVSISSIEDNPFGSVGKVIPVLEYKIADVGIEGVGELLVKGAPIMAGYYNQPHATKNMIQDGWLHTGDIVRVDPEENIYIVGRKRNLIVNKGGKNIYASELEGYINKISFVIDAQVISKIDGKKGECPHAIVAIDKEKFYREMGGDDCQWSMDDIEKIMLRFIREIMSETSTYKLPKTADIVFDRILPEREPFYFGDHYLNRIQDTDTGEESSAKKLADLSGSDISIVDAYLLDKFFDKSRIEAEGISKYSLFSEFGIDSLSMMKIRFNIEKEIGCSVPLGVLGECSNVAEISNLILFGEGFEKIRYGILGALLCSGKQVDSAKNIFEFILDEINISLFEEEELDDVYMQLMTI